MVPTSAPLVTSVRASDPLLAAERHVSDQRWIDRLRFRGEVPTEERVRVLKRFQSRRLRLTLTAENSTANVQGVNQHQDDDDERDDHTM